MNSYYDTILDRVENEMKRGCFEEAMKLLGGGAFHAVYPKGI